MRKRDYTKTESNETMVRSNKCRVITEISHPVLSGSGICVDYMKTESNKTTVRSNKCRVITKISHPVLSGSGICVDYMKLRVMR